MGEDDETHELIIPGKQRLFEVLPGLKAPAMVALPEAGAASTTRSCARNIDRAIAKHRDRVTKREFLAPHRDGADATTLEALERASDNGASPAGPAAPARDQEPVRA